MSDFWDILRIVNFTILFITFLCMIHKAVGRLALDKHGFNWDKFMNLLWVTLSMGALAEILFQHAEGGWRIVASTVVMLLQLYVVIFRYRTDPYNELVQVESD